ncbi:uncharacterized protein AB675_6490 [Cyphellophora attinorum]|uniref:Uncharacterized protein n=1 Tax=Cyphellophora attinorum TaxID=1664694 RepID=A0A0N1HFB4_9EURO|nr:uncharacterized protein AB675_6490 [Phialophora attinorum]KPI43953.1 hypothetical protein AB675_6490 [Phialophora attinorum]
MPKQAPAKELRRASKRQRLEEKENYDDDDYSHAGDDDDDDDDNDYEEELGKTGLGQFFEDEDVWESDPEEDDEISGPSDKSAAPMPIEEFTAGVKERTNPIFFDIIMMYILEMFSFCSVSSNWSKLHESPYTRNMFRWIHSWKDLLLDDIALVIYQVEALRKLMKLYAKDRKKDRGIYINIMVNDVLSAVGCYVGSTMRNFWKRITTEHLNPKHRKRHPTSHHYSFFKDDWSPCFIVGAFLRGPFDSQLWAFLIEVILMIELGAYCLDVARKNTAHDFQQSRQWARQLRKQSKQIRLARQDVNQIPSRHGSRDEDDVQPLNHALPLKQGIKDRRTATNCALLGQSTVPAATSKTHVDAVTFSCDRCGNSKAMKVPVGGLLSAAKLRRLGPLFANPAWAYDRETDHLYCADCWLRDIHPLHHRAAETKNERRTYRGLEDYAQAVPHRPTVQQRTESWSPYGVMNHLPKAYLQRVAPQLPWLTFSEFMQTHGVDVPAGTNIKGYKFTAEHDANLAPDNEFYQDHKAAAEAVANEKKAKRKRSSKGKKQ